LTVREQNHLIDASLEACPDHLMSPPDLTEKSLVELSDYLASNQVSSQGLVAFYTQRISQIDTSGPELRSVIEVNPDAFAIAGELDQERRNGRIRSPLHGVPILIKDNIASNDQMETTAGSLALVGCRPKEDAFVVKQLRSAGAVILGKTNMTEWSNGRSFKSSSGWSGRGGLTRNPYVLDRSASGSSSGSAVAVSANLCAAAIGTETDGSIVGPAAVCGIVGLKPTVGLVSRSGIIPLSHSFDTPGPMGRTVMDCALLLNSLVGLDRNDRGMHWNTSQYPTSFSKSIDHPSLRGARLGVLRQFFGTNDSVHRAFEPVWTMLRDAGAVLIDPVTIQQLEKVQMTKRTVLLHEMKSGMNSYLGKLEQSNCPRNLADLIAFNRRNRASEMKYFEQEIFDLSQSTGPLTSAEYLEALEVCQHVARTEGIERAMRDFDLDALVAPTCGPAWSVDLLLGDHSNEGSSLLAAAAGTPSITVPATSIHGLPLGLTLFGNGLEESRLISLAAQFERLTCARRRPQFLPTLNTNSLALGQTG